MDTKIKIRPALATEHEALCALICELDDYHRLARPDVFRKPPGAAREPNVIEALIAGPDSTILVAELPDKTLAGLVILIAKSIPASPVRDARSFVEIDALIVGSEGRRRGVATCLISDAKVWAETRDIHHFEVSAWSFNIGAIAFYREIGFQSSVERLGMSF